MGSHWEVSLEVGWFSLSEESHVLRAGREQVPPSLWGTSGGG